MNYPKLYVLILSYAKLLFLNNLFILLYIYEVTKIYLRIKHMKYEEIKIEYVNSINDIIEKANNFSDIKNLNDYIQDSISKYEELIRTYKNECSSFLVNYDSIKDNHLKMLKIELNKYNLNYELELLKEGNIYSYRKNIENYIKNNKYLDEIAIIIAINVYSSFESIRKDLKKSEYPYLYEFITQLSHLKPSSFPVTSLNRSIMAVKFSFLLTTSSILAISSKIAKNACIAIAKV